MTMKIFVAMHQPHDHVQKITNPIYVPIHCGKAIYTPQEIVYYTEGDPVPKWHQFLPDLGDNSGDNISRRNRSFCELTAMYWAWKNDSSDIVGLNHYRRYFHEPGDETKLLSQESIIELLDEADFLINGSSTDFRGHCKEDESVYASYSRTHVKEDMDAALQSISELFPDPYPMMADQILHSAAMCVCNMFVAKRKAFEEYCNFLFPVLFAVESKINLNDDKHQGYNQRVFGFLAERLFRPWLIASEHSGKQLGQLNWERYAGYIWR